MSKINVAVGAVFGAVVGFVTGVLVAPKSGKETREDLKNAANSAKDKTVEVAHDVARRGKEAVSDVGTKAEELKGRTFQAVDGAKKGFEKNPPKK